MLHWFYESTLFTLALGAFAGVVLWTHVWIRVAQTQRLVPTLRAGAALPRPEGPPGRVCVVVPAHDEARVIAALVRSLLAETYPRLRVVLALDRCTDDTAAIARATIAGDDRFEIVEIDECPPDWAGKVHAVHQGVVRSRAAAEADYLLFADADTEFVPGCISAAIALMHHRGLDLLSLLSTLTHETWFERVVQTAAVLELMTQYPLPRANGGPNRRAFANGQFMLFTRAAYTAIGGHEPVKDALLEDIALARRVDQHRLRGGVFLAAGLFRCRMYADWAQFRRGWKRIFTEAADRKPRRLVQWAWRSRWLGTLVPVWTQVTGIGAAIVLPSDPLAGALLAVLWLLATTLWLGSLARIAAMSHAPVWTAPLHVVGAWMTASLLSEAASDLRARVPTRWGGREYDLGVKRA